VPGVAVALDGGAGCQHGEGVSVEGGLWRGIITRAVAPEGQSCRSSAPFLAGV